MDALAARVPKWIYRLPSAEDSSDQILADLDRNTKVYLAAKDRLELFTRTLYVYLKKAVEEKKDKEPATLKRLVLLRKTALRGLEEEFKELYDQFAPLAGFLPKTFAELLEKNKTDVELYEIRKRIEDALYIGLREAMAKAAPLLAADRLKLPRNSEFVPYYYKGFVFTPVPGESIPSVGTLKDNLRRLRDSLAAIKPVNPDGSHDVAHADGIVRTELPSGQPLVLRKGDRTIRLTWKDGQVQSYVDSMNGQLWTRQEGNFWTSPGRAPMRATVEVTRANLRVVHEELSTWTKHSRVRWYSPVGASRARATEVVGGHFDRDTDPELLASIEKAMADPKLVERIEALWELWYKSDRHTHAVMAGSGYADENDEVRRRNRERDAAFLEEVRGMLNARLFPQPAPTAALAGLSVSDVDFSGDRPGLKIEIRRESEVKIVEDHDVAEGGVPRSVIDPASTDVLLGKYMDWPPEMREVIHFTKYARGYGGAKVAQYEGLMEAHAEILKMLDKAPLKDIKKSSDYFIYNWAMLNDAFKAADESDRQAVKDHLELIYRLAKERLRLATEGKFAELDKLEREAGPLSFDPVVDRIGKYIADGKSNPRLKGWFASLAIKPFINFLNNMVVGVRENPQQLMAMITISTFFPEALGVNFVGMTPANEMQRLAGAFQTIQQGQRTNNPEMVNKGYEMIGDSLFIMGLMYGPLIKNGLFPPGPDATIPESEATFLFSINRHLRTPLGLNASAKQIAAAFDELSKLEVPAAELERITASYYELQALRDTLPKLRSVVPAGPTQAGP